MRRSSLSLALFLAAGSFAASCSGGSSSSGGGSGGDLELTSISVPASAVWQINRPMEFTFNQDVDFASVGPNTINIQTTTGVPANGTFSGKRIDTDGDGVAETALPRVVVFQPRCPTRPDFSDAGLQLPSVSYVITVVGRSSGAQDTVRSTAGARLETTQTRGFTTPVTTDPTVAFIDLVSGPPQPVVRAVGSTRTDGVSYFECGGDPDDRVFFEFDETTQDFSLSRSGFESPLNLYSDPGSRIAAVVVFNQPVSPLASNINQSFLRLEVQGSGGTWRPFETRVELIANCVGGGATVRLEPVGILPVASALRVVVDSGFFDITGQEDNALPMDRFGVAPTTVVAFSSLTPADQESDELFEDFAFGGESTGSREDTTATFDTPPAEWGGGALRAGFTFAGTGGPNGNFDWVIRDGQVVFLDTVSDQITGGEGGAPEAIQNVVGGVVDVRDLIIEEGGTLSVSGSNPLCVNASRDVIIRGTLDISGGNAKDVSSLDTGHQPEPGGVGSAGGGRGGAASTVTTGSTPVGQTGFGPFSEPNAGGMGGETSYQTGANTTNVNRRRPGGGGGGRFAADLADSEYGPGPNAIKEPSTDPRVDVFGLRAQPGTNGFATALGAVDDLAPPNGGQPGAGPFSDADPDNDFWGTRAILDPDTSEVTFVRGELTRLNPGYGGGGGGDASTNDVFPTPSWTIASEEKGGGGGGGAGALHVKALGRIVFGEVGQILCQGGKGATGENTSFLDHVGGGGGGGSGGHVVLESASLIDFTDGMPTMVAYGENPFLMDDGEPFEGGRPRILANGGDGATIGANDDPGDGATTPAGLGYGGDGGPGVIQLHVPESTLRPSTGTPNPTDIVVPLATAIDDAEDYQDLLRTITAPGAIPMVPTFGARSRARSDWISLGAADQGTGGTEEQVLFYFDGVDPMTGLVETVDGQVAELDPILDALVDGSVTVNAAGDAMTLAAAALAPLINDATPLSNDVYLRTPNLLESFALRLSVDGSPGIMRTFDVVSAAYDDAATELTLVVDVGLLGNTIQRFLDDVLDDNPQSAIRYQLIPRFFRLFTGGVADFVGEDATVTISFQAAQADSFGNPDETNILVDFTSDISELNAQPPGAIQFVRFEVGFDLANGAELTVDTEPVEMDFLRIPFRF